MLMQKSKGLNRCLWPVLGFFIWLPSAWGAASKATTNPPGEAKIINNSNMLSSQYPERNPLKVSASALSGVRNSFLAFGAESFVSKGLLSAEFQYMRSLAYRYSEKTQFFRALLPLNVELNPYTSLFPLIGLSVFFESKVPYFAVYGIGANLNWFKTDFGIRFLLPIGKEQLRSAEFETLWPLSKLKQLLGVRFEVQEHKYVRNRQVIERSEKNLYAVLRMKF